MNDLEKKFNQLKEELAIHKRKLKKLETENQEKKGDSRLCRLPASRPHRRGRPELRGHAHRRARAGGRSGPGRARLLRGWGNWRAV